MTPPPFAAQTGHRTEPWNEAPSGPFVSAPSLELGEPAAAQSHPVSADPAAFVAAVSAVGAAAGAPEHAAPVAPSAPAPARVDSLRLTFDTGQSQIVAAAGVIHLGRKPEASAGDEQLVTVRDPDGTVSKTHLRIELRGDEIWLTDLGSTNGSEMFDEVDDGTELREGSGCASKMAHAFASGTAASRSR